MASFSDDFTGTNGAVLRLRGGWSFSGSATFQDRATISNNRVKCGGLGGASAHYGYVRDIGDTQQFVEAKFLRNGATGCCLYARWTNESNFIGVRNNGTNVELIKRVAGTITSVVSIAAGLAVGDTVRIELRGTTAKLFRNGAQIGAGGGYTISDSALQTATKVGLGGEGAAGSFEVFDDIAGGGLTVTLAPADGSHVSRPDAGGVRWRGRLVAADGFHAGRGDAGGVAVRCGLAPADGRHVSPPDAGGVRWRGRLVAADGFHAGRGDAGGVTIRCGLAPADGRHVSRSDAGGVRWRGRLVAADGFHAGRGDAGSVGFRARVVLAPAKGEAAIRSSAAAISLRILVAAARGRSALRGTALLLPSIGSPGAGEVTRIGPDSTVYVRGDATLTRIGAD